MAEVVRALDWARLEMVRMRAPDQGRLMPREMAVQKLCSKLLRDGLPERRKARSPVAGKISRG